MSFQSAKHASGSSNREAKGFLFLLLILVLPFLVQYIYRGFFYTPQHSALLVHYVDTCDDKQFPKKYNSDSYSKSSGYAEASKLKTTTKVLVIDINTADSVQFETLPGIGSAFASRILKYRKLLGGYTRVEQLKEVYGMPEETYTRIAPMCMVSITSVKKIAADSLWNYPYKIYHPYLSKELKATITAKKKSQTYSEAVLKQLVLDSNEKLTWYMKW